MRTLVRRLLALAALAALGWPALLPRPAAADPIPPGAEMHNLRLIGFSGLGGHSAAFKLALNHAPNGRWYLYTGHSFESGWSIVEVTDPRNPRYVRFIPGPAGIGTSQVTVHGNLMITGLAPYNDAPGMPRAVDNAILLWDISDPENPRQVGAWRGADSGSHRNSYPGGRYAYLATSHPGYRGRILVILDVSDPANPKEAGLWWQPGQKIGESASGRVSPGIHGPASVSPDEKLLVMGYYPQIVNLDISDVAHPKLLGALTMTPPFADVGSQSEHTVLPFWDRQLLYVSSEASQSECKDPGMHYAGLVDNRDPAKPRLISLLPLPRPPAGKPYKNFCEKGGRFGAHNVSQEIHNPAVQQPGSTLYIAYFNAGLQMFDISDPYLPANTGYFIPPERPDLAKHPTGGPHESPINWCEDVVVDTRGNIYVGDDKWGIWIVRDPKNPGKP